MLQGLLLIAGGWAWCIGAVWLALAQLPSWQRRFPQARQGASAVFIVASLFVVVVWLHPVAGNVITALATGGNTASRLSFTITTTPSADIYLAGDYLGQSPLQAELSAESELSVAIIANPLSYAPYIQTLKHDSDRTLDITLFHRQEAIVEPGLLPQDIIITDRVDDGRIQGEVDNQSGLVFDYLLLIYLLYQDDQRVGYSYALVHQVADEKLSFSSHSIPTESFDDYALAKIQSIVLAKTPMAP